MAFDSLTQKLQNVFKNLRGKGLLTEADVKAALKEVKMALLEADVNFRVVKNFIKSVEEKAVGEDVLGGLNPAQTVIKIVRDELVELMGGETTELKLKNANDVTVIMLMGLQGAGKTTSAAKLASNVMKKGRKPLLAGLDVYRPAAIEQLRVNAEKVNADVFTMTQDDKPADIARAAVAHAKKIGCNVVILDTAGRLQIDEDMMQELVEIKAAVDVDDCLLTIDAMTGQEAVNVAKAFDEQIGIDGVIITKLDGDTRGGAALSVRAVTGKPIYYVGMGEKLTDLEQFYPDRMASRILGMGDMLTMIEKAQESFNEEQAADLERRMKKNQFTFDDFLLSMQQMKNMGGIGSMLSMMPGMTGAQADQVEAAMDEKKMARLEGIIHSMTPKERANPDILNPSRKRRIAAGAGVQVQEVNRLVKQFEQTQKLMKQMNGGGSKGKKKRRGSMNSMFGRNGLPF